MKIIVFGDSIPYGIWDDEGGWAQRLKQFLHEKTLSSNMDEYYMLYNLSVSGNTTVDLLKRFEFEILERLKEEKDRCIIIFAIGTNDAQWINNENKMRTSEEEFKINIQKLIDLAKKYTKDIIFVGVLPFDESKTTPIPWDTLKEFWNKNGQKYNDIIKNVCEKNNVIFVELLDKWKTLEYKELLKDGLHPNSEGHKLIFEEVKKTLSSESII